MYPQRARQEGIVLATNKPWTSHRVHTKHNYSSPSTDEINIPAEEFPSTTTHIRPTCSCAASMPITYQCNRGLVPSKRSREIVFFHLPRSDCSESSIEFDIYIIRPGNIDGPLLASSSGLKKDEACTPRERKRKYFTVRPTLIWHSTYICLWLSSNGQRH